MKIEILSVQDNFVTFKSHNGMGQGKWISDSLPTPLSQHDVEFDLEDQFIWGKNIKPSESHDSRMKIQQGGVHFIGSILPETFEAEAAAIRVGESIILIEITNLPDGFSGLVAFWSENIRLYPTNL